MEENDTEPNRILFELIKRYGDQLRVNRVNFAKEFGRALGKSPGGARKILEGKTETMREPMSQSISEFCNSRGVSIDPTWLTMGYDYFVSKLDEHKDTIRSAEHKQILVPNFETTTNEHRRMLAQFADKRFSTYRYAFEDTGRIAKELIYFHKEGDRLQFDYYFRVGGEEREDTFCTCTGEAFIVGNSVCMLGVYNNPETGTIRPRFMILSTEPENLSRNKFRHGIIASNTPSGHAHPDQPASAKVLLVRSSTGGGGELGRPDTDEIMDQVAWIEPNGQCGALSGDDWQKVKEHLSNQSQTHILYLNGNNADELMRSLESLAGAE